MRALLAVLLLALACPVSGQADRDPNGHRLLFAPTAHPVRAGGVTVGVASLVVPNVTVGFGRGATLGAGVVLHRGGWGTVFAEPKWTVHKSDRLAVAVGASGQVRLQDGTVRALPYVVATAARGRAAVTAGFGGRIDHADRIVGPIPIGCPECGRGVLTDPSIPERERAWTLAPRPSAMLGANVRLRPGLATVAEVAAYPGPEAGHYSGSAGLGLRIRHRRAVFDLGAAVISDGGGEQYTYATPWLNVGVGF